MRRVDSVCVGDVGPVEAVGVEPADELRRSVVPGDGRQTGERETC